MPRQPRLEIEGGFYHIINRGIERRKIFKKPKDYKMFLKTFGTLLSEEGHKCYGWVLMSNHYHLLIERGKRPLSRLMTRLQTTYAGYFNRTYHRSGRFFQNRYKAILCDKESYFLELVAYLHLNPLRAGIVKNVSELIEYRWSGHLVLLEKNELKWQSIEEVLARFGKNRVQARNNYIQFLKDKAKEKMNLSGGGLIRSAGSLKMVLNRKKDEYELFDSRILGDGQFVEAAANRMEEKIKIEELLGFFDQDMFIKQASNVFRMSSEELSQKGRSSSKKIIYARALMIYISVEYYKIKQKTWVQYYGISSAAISKLFVAGEKLAAENKGMVDKLLKFEVRHVP